MSENEESDVDLMESKDKLFYKEVLCSDTKLRWNFEKVYHCSKSSGVNWKVAEELDWFLFYIFYRRFGWPDLEEENGQLKVVLPDSQIRFRRSGKGDELKYKSQLVDMLDSILLWLSHQPVSSMSLLMYSSAIRLASKSPVTRLHLTIHGYDWLKENLPKEINVKLGYALQEFLILGITDFWSRIRDATILRLGPIIELLELSKILALFDELVRFCDSNVNQWQIIDGAISAICAILKRFQKVGYKSEYISTTHQIGLSSPQFHYQIRVGDTELDRMPPNIISRLQFLVFQLIYHPQQTIRDNAIKAFVLCLDRYYDNDADTAFQNVCQKLSGRDKYYHQTSLSKSNFKSISHHGQQSYSDAYGAQSLICLCHHLFKRLADKTNYLENWQHYHCYFDHYLAHSASSVRIVTSNLYTYVVSQAISYPLLVKNIIHNLIVKWSPDQSILLKSITELMTMIESKSKNRMSIVKIEDNKDESQCWEWREGRLLVFELLAKLIIKNHLWYTFGTTKVDSVYSSDNTNSKPSGSRLLNDSLGQSFLNLCGSSNGLHNEQIRENSEKDILSMSLDGRRVTLSNLPVRNLQFKALSENNIPIITEDDEEAKRRKSHDMLSSKVNESELSSKNLSITKLNVATSTKNISSIIHFSFLMHVKEMESVDAECSNLKNNIDNNKAEQKLPTFRSLLSQMLHTTAESLIDSQWELRRMAKQALPPLGEVLRWYDPELLVNIINTHLKFEPTLMTSISLQLLHDSLLHTSRLKQLFSNPPSSWQPSVACKIVNNIVTNVEQSVPQWLKSCQHYLDRSALFDCITPHAINIIITCISHYFNVIPVSTLTRSFVEAIARLDKCIKNSGSNFITICNFELYPSHSSLLSADSASLDYAIQLINFIKQGLLVWWQKLANPVVFQDYYDQHKESIISCSRLMAILASWLHPVSEMRGENASYLRDIHKLLHFLLKLLIEVMRIDDTTKHVFANEFIQLIDVLSSYVQHKNLKLDIWWIRQLMDEIFLWMEVFNISDLEQCYTEKFENKPIFFATLKALLQRLNFSNNKRRATICTISSQTPERLNSKTKRHSMDGNQNFPKVSVSNLIQLETETNLELFSSQANNENVEYVSDESLNDNGGGKNIEVYQESHVLSCNELSTCSHSLPSLLDMSSKKPFSHLTVKSNSSLAYEDNCSEKVDLPRTVSSVNSDSADERDASDWDSCSESEEALGITGTDKSNKPTNEIVLISELISKFIQFNPKLYEPGKSLLAEFDITDLQWLKL